MQDLNDDFMRSDVLADGHKQWWDASCRESVMPEEYKDEMRAAAKKVNLDFDKDFKLTDNTCKPHPADTDKATRVSGPEEMHVKHIWDPCYIHCKELCCCKSPVEEVMHAASSAPGHGCKNSLVGHHQQASFTLLWL